MNYQLSTVLFLMAAQIPMMLTAQNISHLLCENRENPLGIDERNPRFSWQINNNERNTHQTAYELAVATDLTTLSQGQNLLWTSGKINADSSVMVRYKGP